MNVSGLFGILSLAAWAALVLLVVLFVGSNTRGRPIRGMGAIILVVTILAVILSSVSSSLVFINPDERGVVLSGLAPAGYREEILQPGLRFVTPFFESVVIYPISRQTYTMSIAPNEGKIKGDDSIAARTLDGQEVLVDASVIYSVDPVKVIQVHINWKNRFGDELVRPQARGIIRDAVSQYGIQEVYSTKRLILVEAMRSAMEKKLSENGLILVDFILRNLTFSKEYAASVEQKQVAEQQSQQAKFVVESKKQEAEQARQVAQGKADAQVIASKGEAEARLIQAEAEAKSLEFLTRALKNNPELLSYQYITRLSPNVQVILLPSEGSTPFIYQLPQIPTVEPGSTNGTSPAPTLVPTPAPTSRPVTAPTPIPTPRR